MLEKLFLAVTTVLCLKLFLGVSLTTANPSTSGYHLVETPTVTRLLFSGQQQ